MKGDIHLPRSTQLVRADSYQLCMTLKSCLHGWSENGFRASGWLPGAGLTRPHVATQAAVETARWASHPDRTLDLPTPQGPGGSTCWLLQLVLQM